MKFFKTHWLSILLMAVLCYILLKSQDKTNELVKQVDALEITNEELVKQSSMYLMQIDSLENVDADIIETIKYIKIKEDEAITAVDTMSVSDLQQFFTERYDN